MVLDVKTTVKPEVEVAEIANGGSLYVLVARELKVIVCEDLPRLIVCVADVSPLAA